MVAAQQEANVAQQLLATTLGNLNKKPGLLEESQMARVQLQKFLHETTKQKKNSCRRMDGSVGD